MYAVIEAGAKQYRVEAGTTLEVERLAEAAGQDVVRPVLKIARLGGTRELPAQGDKVLHNIPPAAG